MKWKRVFNNFFVNEHSKTYVPLKENERILAEEIYPIIYEEIKNNYKEEDNAKEESPKSFKEKFQITYENLTRVIELFKEMDPARKEFKKEFHKFKSHRLNSIKAMLKNADSIDLDRLNCNISKVVAIIAGLGGGSAMIASFFVPPAAPALMYAGGAVFGASGTTTFFTNVVELALLKRKMKKVKKILKQEQKNFSRMSNWFDNSLEVVAAAEALISFDILQELVKNMKKYFKDAKKCNDSKGKIKLVVSGIFKLAGWSTMGPEIAAIAVTFFVVMIGLRYKNYYIFDCIVLTHRLVFGFLAGLDLGTEVGSLIAMAFVNGAAKMGNNAARLIFHGVFIGIGMSLDAINLIFTIHDLTRGSKSQIAEKIREAAKRLKEELDVLEDVYVGVEKEENESDNHFLPYNWR